MEQEFFDGISCPVEYVLALKDAQNAITGKWKMAIVSTLIFEKKRFSEIKQMIPNITPRMLSKELKELEINGIVNRNVYDSTPVLVEYELTDSGVRLRRVLDQMVQWGLQHRKETIAEIAQAS